MKDGHPRLTRRTVSCTGIRATLNRGYCQRIWGLFFGGLLFTALATGQTDPATVRVAAIQMPSAMGETESNLETIARLVRVAADRGARNVVLPECAVQGYMDPVNMISWTKSEPGRYAVQRVAEPVPGPSTRQMAALARDLNLYLCIGLVESANHHFFNSQVLFGPDGAIIGHHRKKALWRPGDAAWCTRGDRPIQVVDTEFGRLGMTI